MYPGRVWYQLKDRASKARCCEGRYVISICRVKSHAGDVPGARRVWYLDFKELAGKAKQSRNNMAAR